MSFSFPSHFHSFSFFLPSLLIRITFIDYLTCSMLLKHETKTKAWSISKQHWKQKWTEHSTLTETVQQLNLSNVLKNIFSIRICLWLINVFVFYIVVFFYHFCLSNINSQVIYLIGRWQLVFEENSGFKSSEFYIIHCL